MSNVIMPRLSFPNNPLPKNIHPIKDDPTERKQVEKPITRYDYLNGPMWFLAQQIIRHMQDAGYPAFVWCLHRPPEQQQKEFDDGDSKARPWQSPHQYLEAVDILHPVKYWGASQTYWDTLAAAVHVVEEKFGVDLVHGYDWGWDSAHIEIADWRTVPKVIGRNTPNQAQLDARFAQVLPKPWKQFLRSKRGAEYAGKQSFTNHHGEVPLPAATAWTYPRKPRKSQS